jgi:hypothetical protein
MLKIVDKDGQTALHLISGASTNPSSGMKPLETVNELLDNLALSAKYDLVIIKDNNNFTILDLLPASKKEIKDKLIEIKHRGDLIFS